MYDPDSKKYRSRELFSTCDFKLNSKAGREEIKGIEIFKANAVKLLSDEINAKGRLIKGSIKYDNKVCTAILNRDIDGRVIHAQCNCSHFRYHKLQQGPCRHIVALSLTSE